MNSKNFKNGIMGLYTTQAKYLHDRLRISFSMPPLFNGFYFMQCVCMLPIDNTTLFLFTLLLCTLN